MQTTRIKPRLLRRNDKAAYVMILPAYLIFTVFILLPVGLVAYYSFTNFNMFSIPELIGLRNYERLFRDGDFLIACANTLVYTIFTLGFQLVIGLFLAVVLYRKSKWTPFFRASIYLPHIMSMVCVSIVWLWIFDPTFGLLNSTLKSLGLETKMWLMDPSMSMFSVIVMSIWKSCGYAMVVFLSGLTGIPSSLYEAAELDGAGVFRKFWNITWPMLKPTTFFLLITGIVNSFAVFEQVNILTNGGPLKTTTTIVHQIYRRGFLDYRMGYASAMAILLLIFSLFVTMSVFKFGNKGQDVEIF
jgi:multiple sugar transport system permease protein